MIDSHCHLADEVFAGDLEAVVDRAQRAGLERAFVILEAGHAGEAAQADTLERMWPEVRFAIGVHPHHAGRYGDDPAGAASEVRTQLLTTPGARAIGEIGLDYHYDYSPPAVQREVFRAQLRLARELGTPIVIHTREADEDTIAILDEEGGGELRGVVHCFTGDTALALAALGLGLYISASGIVTFPKSSELRHTLKYVPLGRLLTETDSPFLSPVPFRGQRNEPAHVSRIVETLAGLHGIPAAEMARHASDNFHTLFQP